MTDLYILEEINDNDLDNILEKTSSNFVSFDYPSHKELSKRDISHQLIDDFLTDSDRKKLFNFCISCLKKINEYNDSNLIFHDINLVNLIDRNELHEFLMNILPKIKVINKILDDHKYEKIFLPSKLYNIFNTSQFKNKINLIKTSDDISTTYEKIEIPIKFGNLNSTIKLERKKYQQIKTIVEQFIGSFLNLKKNNKNKIILLEFDPVIYNGLLQEITKFGFQPILINFRKSPIYNFESIQSLFKSKSLVVIPKNLFKKNQLNELNKNKIFLFNEINKIIKNKTIFLNLDYEQIDFSYFLQNKINQLLIQRYEEYMIEILVAEYFESRNDIKSILTLNFSGENEKVFSKIVEKHPFLLLQHAFANYVESISHFDVLDDFDLIKNKIAIWGDVVHDYLINIKKIDANKIIVTGSPKYDFYEYKNKINTDKKIILVTLRPIINHMEGQRINLFDRYEKSLQKIVQLINNNDKIEIIFKLHPQQNSSNEIIRNMIPTSNNIKFLHHESIKELLQNCDLHVNIATDNFDASSVVVEAMLLEKPTLNIQLQSNTIDFEFIKDNSIKLINYDDDIVEEILYLLDSENSSQLIKNSQRHLMKYMKNRNNASNALVSAIRDF